ncbi:Protein CBG16936 [Caenorhabditis briggsae]|uniref:Protein CBG16936 n=1 Tax=Caenorhabditis briggsae TaxID=6238 RepID=A8XQ36_CAEBR|nr:Protein CBG16936 [Caenorhabditis briggsae]CAP34761.2 Protein CBG16936 [Caenorhabditis briggsae]
MRNHNNYSFRWGPLLTLILTFLSSGAHGSEQCGSDLKPQKLVVVGVWKRSFDNSTAQYRISDEDLSVRGYERANTDKATSTVMLARHPESCIVHECGVRLSAMMQVNGAILHTDHRSIRMNDSTMDNIEDEFYCADKSGFCGADVPIYRLVQHSLNGPRIRRPRPTSDLFLTPYKLPDYSYSFDNVGQSQPGYEKEFFPLCYAWRQTPSVVLFNSSDNGVCLKIPDVENGKIEYSNNQLNVFSIGTSATLRCDSRFVGNGTNNLLCTKDGWYPRQEMMGNCVSQETSKKPLRLVVASDVVNPEATCPISTTPNGNVVYSANVAASTSKTSVPSATRATVLCNLGFVPTTSVTSSTCVDGEWIPALPQCLSLLDLKCPILSAPRNGELVFTNSPKPPYSLDSTISLKCDRNFFGMGNLTAKCTSSGWDQKIGRCEPVGIRKMASAESLSTGTPCSAIASPANGNLLYVQSSLSQNYASGTSAYLMCSLGTSLSGSVSTMCTNGQWSPAIGQCTSAPTLGQTTGNCAAIPNPVNGTVTYTSGLGTYTSGTIATLTCNFMSTVSGSATSTCLSGIWNPAMGTCTASGTGGVGTGTTCPNPVVINGVITYSQGNPLDVSQVTRPMLTTASLRCNNGYTLSGNSLATCISGAFTPSLGTCTLGTSGGTGTTCSTPFIMNGVVTFSQGNTWDQSLPKLEQRPNQLTRPSGTTGTLSCNSGYSVTGNSQATCTNGVFTPALGTCNLGTGTGGVGTGTTCPNPVVINGNITYSQGNPLDTTRPALTTAMLNCNSGYTLTGNTIATCISGTFTPSLGTCTLGTSGGTGTTCSTPFIMNGIVTFSQGNTWDLTRPSGTTGTLSCNSGYSVTGNSQATCTNGVFTPTLGTCTSELEQEDQGNPLDTTRPALTTAMLYCNNGFTLTGNSIATCISGTFTPSLGTCTLGSSGGTGTTCSTPFIMNGIVTFSQGYVYDLTRPSGTTGTLSCNSGYSVTGNSQATCTNGVFTPALGTCNLGTGTGGVGTMQCTAMIAPIGGNVTYSNGGQIGPFPSGTTVTGSCTNGGAVQGASSAQCSNGMWSPMFLGTCSLIGGSTTGQCSAPTLPAGAQATYVPFSLSTTSYTSGTVATVTCTSGGSSLGSTTCTNGLWSPAITGICSGTGTGTTCPALTRPVGESVTYDGQTSFATTFNTGEIARVTCTNGTQIGQASCLGGQWIPAITATCSGSSTAIGTQCIGVIAPANSQVRYSDGDMVLHASGATVTLTCLNSATVTGNTISTCTNGAWTPTLGTCSSSGTSTGPCYTPPLTPTGATLTYSSGFFAPWTAGSTATMSCPSGQTAQGTTVTYCTNAAWAPALGTCSGSGTGLGQATTLTTMSSTSATCQYLPIAPPYSTIVTSQTAPYSSGTVVTLQCDSGYQVQGQNTTSTCQNGLFTEITAQCTRI